MVGQTPGLGGPGHRMLKGFKIYDFSGMRQDRTIRRSAGSFPVRLGIRAMLSVWAEVVFVVGATW
jgi:hypothetical protein